MELDSRVAIEVYLRQKKDAILDDKKIRERDPDAESKLSVVQQSLPALAQKIED